MITSHSARSQPPVLGHKSPCFVTTPGPSVPSIPFSVSQVKQRLKTFNARRKFRAAAYASIATNQLISKTKALRKILGGLDHVASEEELKELHGHFKRM